MPKLRIIVPIAIAAVVLILVVATRAGAFLPQASQVLVNRGIYTATGPEKNLETLEAQHKATKVKRDGEETYNYTKDDRELVERDSAKCIACHGTMVDKGKKPENATYYIHQKMLTAAILDFRCTDCHKEVDISRRSPDKATFRIDRTLCPKCHETGGIPAGLSASGEVEAGAPPQMPPLLKLHGTDQKSGKKWIKDHPKVAMSVGVGQCRKCHKYNSELDFCRVCHLRGGMRPDHHRVVINVAINRIFPDMPKKEVVETKWLGFHFVFVREALADMGVYVDSPRRLPMDKIEKLPCGACHNLQDWCTRCHIKHNPKWLDPVEGHPLYVKRYGTKYCFRCHDTLGSKCVSHHTFAGRLN